MGTIRGIFLVVVSVLLLLSIFCTISLGVLSSSLEYKFVENESAAIVEGMLDNSQITTQIEEFYPLIQSYCQNNTEYVFSVENYTINVPCDIALQGSDTILKEGIKDVIHQVYYAESDCNFLDCIKSNEIPVFLLSEKSHNFLENMFYIFLLISFALSIILFFLVEKKANLFILVGIFSVLSSSPFIKLDIFFASSNEILSQILKIFFSQSFYIALRVLILGIIFIVLGIIFKIFKIGFFISDLISKIKSKSSVGKKQPIKKEETKSVESSLKKKSK